MKAAPHPAIANDKVNYVGDAVAVVIAETLEQAKDAAEKVIVDYEVLPAVTDPRQGRRRRAHRKSTRRRRTTRFINWHIGEADATAERLFRRPSTSPRWISST